MSDYISRETAIRLIKYYAKSVISAGRKSLDPVDDIIVMSRMIETLAPSADVEPEQYWTPCSERLPEICMINGELVNYLIYSPDFSSCGAAVDIGNYVPDAGKWFCMGIPCRVTHWALLPEPPEEGESDHG